MTPPPLPFHYKCVFNKRLRIESLFPLQKVKGSSSGFPFPNAWSGAPGRAREN